MPRVTTPAADRVLARIVKDANGCWVWTGALSSGYGVIQVGRGVGTDKVHRVVYRALVGPIPDGFTIDHVWESGCRSSACVNPAHLEAVTRSENARRQWADGRADPGKFNRAKTHCPRGHPYDVENTYINGGRRHCRACGRDRSRH